MTPRPSASYNIGTPGEVSYPAELAKVAELLANPFTDGRLIYRLATLTDHCRNARRPWIPQGALQAHYQAAALRWLTRGEGE